MGPRFEWLRDPTSSRKSSQVKSSQVNIHTACRGAVVVRFATRIDQTDLWMQRKFPILDRFPDSGRI